MCRILSGRFQLGYWIIVLVIGLQECAQSFRGPTFTKEPPNKIVFHNSSGAIIPCHGTGVPQPTIHWTKGDWTRLPNIPGLRHSRQDGSLVFQPFRAEEYRQDIHGAVYRCIATNSFGSVGSTEVHVRGVVLQEYQAHVYDEYVIHGNTAVFRCQVPDFMKEFLTVTSWTRDDGLVIVHHKNAGAKYIVLKDGELHIRNAARGDSFKKYRCLVKNTLTGNVTPSVSAGTLIVTDPTGSIPPRITSGRPGILIREGENAELPCTAQGYPVPQYTWYRRENNRLVPLVISNQMILVNGSLFIERTRPQDTGKYICIVNNSVGEVRVETELTVYGNLSVSLFPAQLTTESGRSATLNCSVQGYPVHSITWFKDTRHLATSNRVRLIANQVLHITSVLREDQGMYQCFVYGSLQSIQSSAQIVLSEDAPVLKYVFNRQTVQPGERFSLRCVAAGNPIPRVTWSLDSRPIPENHRVQYGDFVSIHAEVVSFVNVSSARSEDGGVYECRAQNEAGSVSHKERVDVLGPPFIRSMNNVTVVDGDSLFYHCPASGFPLPTITWSKDGRELPFNERQQVNMNGSFYVKDVTRETDEGTYICTAINKQKERIQKELHVRVMKKPRINPFAFPKFLAEGNHVIVTCSVLTGDPPITIRWLKDGMTLNKKMLNIDESSMGHLGSALVFNSVGRSHNGNYTCLAENAAGESNFTATMLVNVPPRWRVEPVDATAVVGDSVVFDCQAEGYPQPLIRWKKATGGNSASRNFKSIISNYHIQTLENGSLSIKDLTEEDRGHYLCEAANGVGADLSTVVKLSVHVAAHFKTPFRVHRVSKGDSLNIQCEATGENPIKIEWSKDKVMLNSNTETRYNIKDELTTKGKISTLMVTTPDRRDSALFSCTATNAFGKDDTNIQVLVEEVPDPPSEILATDVSSRGVVLSWSVPYTGNSPVTKYVLYWKTASGSWSTDVKKTEIPGSNTSISISGLMPMTTYYFKLQAENAIGRSSFGEVITVTTDEEVPSEAPMHVEAIPLSTHSIRVLWKPPPASGTHGKIRGYYVGHKIRNSADHLIYKTIEESEFDSTLECTITNLRRGTEYSIIVQAFNNRGTGPPSKEIYVKTHENDPPPCPVLRVVSSTSTAVVLGWDIPSADSTPVKGYKLFYRAELPEWDEIEVPDPSQSQYTLRSLSCGTRYQFHIIAYNDVGRSDPSDVVSLMTQGGSPIAPEKMALLSINTTFVVLNLYAWKNGGCPISFFVVQYKAKGQREWVLVSSNLDPRHEEFVVTGLNPATWYNLLMSAHNEAGATEAEYVFATLTVTGGTITPIVAGREESPLFYRNLSVLVPIVCAIVVLLVITLVILIVCLKKNRNPDYATPSQNQENRTEQKGDNISMASVGKKVYETPRETLYYPSPYATTRISMYSADSESSSGQTNSLQRPSGTHRAEHTYDVPFPQKNRSTSISAI
ncbi:unnamed protein product [Larinioides sclopetarius]|uniref:Down syndrome cell adhesion molecule n=1 Tax=Larinioides sclopetarius TaxID=280406 RepID=A0AAV1ZAE2_9ARAC